MTSLDEALERAEHELEAARERLDEYRAQVESQEQIVAELNAEVTGLRMAATRDEEVDGEDRQTGVSRVWQVLGTALETLGEVQTRTDAIVQVLESADRPLSPSEITEALTCAGRTDTIHAVSATLTYLAQRGRVRNVARGQWEAVREAL